MLVLVILLSIIGWATCLATAILGYHPASLTQPLAWVYGTTGRLLWFLASLAFLAVVVVFV